MGYACVRWAGTELTGAGGFQGFGKQPPVVVVVVFRLEIYH